jgi:hypothetical protein
MRTFVPFLMFVATTALAQAPETQSLEEFRSGGPPPAEPLMLGTFRTASVGSRGGPVWLPLRGKRRVTPAG